MKEPNTHEVFFIAETKFNPLFPSRKHRGTVAAPTSSKFSSRRALTVECVNFIGLLFRTHFFATKREHALAESPTLCSIGPWPRQTPLNVGRRRSWPVKSVFVFPLVYFGIQFRVRSTLPVDMGERSAMPLCLSGGGGQVRQNHRCDCLETFARQSAR